MRIRDLLAEAEGALVAAGAVDGRIDLEFLLCHCLGKGRTALYVDADCEVAPTVEAQFRRLLARRLKREPLAYILAEQEFWSLPFTVSPAVLIPRPETEFLLEMVLAAAARQTQPPGITLDLCCGSGAIAVILALELRRPVAAIDVSWAALQVARQNCRRHGVEAMVHLCQADLLTAINPEPLFSLVVTNPPYVSRPAIDHELAPEVSCYEPHLALDGGMIGMDCIRRIRESLPAVLVPGGEVFMEIGHDQGQLTRELFKQRSSGQPYFSLVEIHQDYAGKDRVLHARLAT